MEEDNSSVIDLENLSINDEQRFLLVDDEEDILELLEMWTAGEYPQSVIRKAKDGEEAYLIIENGYNPTVIVTDLKMPKMNGLKLAKKVLANWPTISIILHSSYMDVLDLIDNISIGFRGLLEKPTNAQQYLKELNSVVENSEFSSKEYLVYPVEKMLENEVHQFNYYVRLGEYKFVHVFKKGDSLNRAKIESFKEKGVHCYYIKIEDFLCIDESLYTPFRTSTLYTGENLDFNLYRKNIRLKKFEVLIKENTTVQDGHHKILEKYGIKRLFLKEDDEIKYQRYLDRVIAHLMENDELDADDKTEMVNEYSERKMKKIYEQPTKENIEKIKNLSFVLQKFSNSKISNISKLVSMQKGNGVFQHALRVAVLCLSILSEISRMKKNPKLQAQVAYFDKTIEDTLIIREMMCLAALMHDIGKSPLQISQNVRIEKLSPLEKEHFIKHIEKGVEILSRYPSSFGPKVSEIVLQHEEFLDGSGHPNKLVKRQLSVYSQLLSMVNFYDNLISQGVLVHDALIEIQMNEEKFNKYLAVVLKRVVWQEKISK